MRATVQVVLLCLFVVSVHAAAPFKITIVPGKSSDHEQRITGAFYVVLANISAEPRDVWETWNSWGYQCISFEITKSDGKSYRVTKGKQSFTRNFPSTFRIPAGGYQVYPISFDSSWKNVPRSELATERVKITAIYEVVPSAESAGQHVWSGRVSSEPVAMVIGW